MTHDSIPDAPSIAQLLMHALLLQDLLDQESLTAGIWYIALDFQLFSVTVFLFWLSRQFESRSMNLKSTAPVLVAGLTLASLFVFNRDEVWDETAFYFFGSYGLGILGYWASNGRYGSLRLALLGMLVTMALLVEFRYRIAVAGVLMLMLGFARQYGALESWHVPRFLTYLGRISFSIFLVHFPLLLMVNATFFHFFPNQPVANAYGLMLALCVSILGGALFYKWVESQPFTNKKHLLLPAGFLASGLLAASGAG
jgi:peptidoglycan/LPS O-acetylase OafA/YrhL